jgi:hypothetical protein
MNKELEVIINNYVNKIYEHCAEIVSSSVYQIPKLSDIDDAIWDVRKVMSERIRALKV